jgi:hypothetical protein
VDLEDGQSALDVGQRHRYLAVEPPRAGERRVQHVGPVGRRDHDHLVGGVEAVHLDEDGVERLAGLLTSAVRVVSPAAPDGVDLVEEDDARGIVFGLLKEVADAGSPDADEHFDEVRAGDGEEWDVGLAGDGLGQQGLAGAGRPDEQDAAGDSPAEPLELARVLQEGDDLLDLFLGLFDAGDVGEGDVGVLLCGDAVSRAPEVAEHAAPAAGAAKQPEHEEPRQQDHDDPRQGVQQDLPDEVVVPDRLPVDVLVLVVQRLHQVLDGLRGILRPEFLAVADALALGRFERPGDRTVARIDLQLLDVAVVELIEELAGGYLLLMAGAPAQQPDQANAEQDQDPPDHQGAGIAGAARRPAIRRGRVSLIRIVQRVRFLPAQSKRSRPAITDYRAIPGGRR